MKLSAIILASGASTRFGEEDKLAAPLHGKPVLRHVLDAVRRPGLHQRLLVTAPGSRLPALAAGEPVQTIINARHHEGMGSSIAAGMAALSPCDGVFILLGDMPFLTPALLETLRARLGEEPRPDIVAPTFEGRRGHPVLFAPSCFTELAGLEGDRGGAGLIASGRYRVALCPVSTAAILRDIDTPEDLRAAERDTGPA